MSSAPTLSHHNQNKTLILRIKELDTVEKWDSRESWALKNDKEKGLAKTSIKLNRTKNLLCAVRALNYRPGIWKRHNDTAMIAVCDNGCRETSCSDQTLEISNDCANSSHGQKTSEISGNDSQSCPRTTGPGLDKYSTLHENHERLLFENSQLRMSQPNATMLRATDSKSGSASERDDKSNKNCLNAVLVSEKQQQEKVLLQLQDNEAVETISFGIQRIQSSDTCNSSDYMSYTERIVKEQFIDAWDKGANEKSIEQHIDAQKGIGPSNSDSDRYSCLFVDINGVLSNLEYVDNIGKLRRPHRNDFKYSSSKIQKAEITTGLKATSIACPASVDACNDDGDVNYEDDDDDDWTGPFPGDPDEIDDADNAAGIVIDAAKGDTISSALSQRLLSMSSNFNKDRAVAMDFSEASDGAIDASALASMDELTATDEVWRNMRDGINEELNFEKGSSILVDTPQDESSRVLSIASEISNRRNLDSSADHTTASGYTVSFDLGEVESIASEALKTVNMPLGEELNDMVQEISQKGPMIVLKWLSPTS